LASFSFFPVSEAASSSTHSLNEKDLFPLDFFPAEEGSKNPQALGEDGEDGEEDTEDLSKNSRTPDPSMPTAAAAISIPASPHPHRTDRGEEAQLLARSPPRTAYHGVLNLKPGPFTLNGLRRVPQIHYDSKNPFPTVATVAELNCPGEQQ
jgi:hypothetical protein